MQVGDVLNSSDELSSDDSAGGDMPRDVSGVGDVDGDGEYAESRPKTSVVELLTSEDLEAAPVDYKLAQSPQHMKLSSSINRTSSVSPKVDCWNEEYLLSQSPVRHHDKRPTSAAGLRSSASRRSPESPMPPHSTTPLPIGGRVSLSNAGASRRRPHSVEPPSQASRNSTPAADHSDAGSTASGKHRLSIQEALKLHQEQKNLRSADKSTRQQIALEQLQRAYPTATVDVTAVTSPPPEQAHRPHVAPVHGQLHADTGDHPMIRGLSPVVHPPGGNLTASSFVDDSLMNSQAGSMFRDHAHSPPSMLNPNPSAASRRVPSPSPSVTSTSSRRAPSPSVLRTKVSFLLHIIRFLVMYSFYSVVGTQTTHVMRLPDACRVTGVCVGDEVSVTNAHLPAIVRYVGETHFAQGLWCGVELLNPDPTTGEPRGKNDGTVDGVKYFVCPPNTGMFCPIKRVHHVCIYFLSFPYMVHVLTVSPPCLACP